MPDELKNHQEYNPTFHIRTFGCQMNVHDSERMAGLLEEKGYSFVTSQDSADLVVINTCSVRDKADQKFFSDLGRLKKVKALRPEMKIAVAGCIAEQQGREIQSRFPYVDVIIGPQNIARLPELLSKTRSCVVATGKSRAYHLKKTPSARAGGCRAWVPVMYGCDNFCSYCIVPYTRGRELSRPVKDVVDEVRSLADQGYSEITLLGQNVNSYGKSLTGEVDFSDLLEQVHTVDAIKRIRFVTSHPKDLSERLMEAFKDLPKLCNHMHLPVQSGSDRVLERMNRGYSSSEYLDKIERLRRLVPDMAFTTDIIVGFPGEEEFDFEQTLKVIRSVEYDGIFAFKYSKRPHTRARLFNDQVPDDKKGRRLSTVLSIQDEISRRKNRDLVGTVQEILVEDTEPSCEGSGNHQMGRTSTNKIVHFESKNNLTGKLLPILITEGLQHSLKGVMLGN